MLQLDQLVHTFNLSTLEAERLGVQSHPQLQNEFEVSLGYRRPYHQMEGKRVTK